MYTEGKEFKQVSEKPEKTKPDEFVKQPLEVLKPTLTNRDESVKIQVDELTDQNHELLTNSEHKFVINGTAFETIQQAVDELKMSRSTIERRLKSDDYPTYYKVE